MDSELKFDAITDTVDTALEKYMAAGNSAGITLTSIEAFRLRSAFRMGWLHCQNADDCP